MSRSSAQFRLCAYAWWMVGSERKTQTSVAIRLLTRAFLSLLLPFPPPTIQNFSRRRPPRSVVIFVPSAGYSYTTRAMPVEVVTPKTVRAAIGELPAVAWPTVCLLLLCILIEITTVSLLHVHLIPRWVAVGVNTAAIFAAFTPMHEASHSTVGLKKLKLLNPIVGWLSGSCFPMPFPAFRTMHLLHHKHTNESLDPDLWAGSGPVFLLPLKWLTIELKYYVWYIPSLPFRPYSETLPTVMYLLCMIFGLRYLLRSPFSDCVLYGWLLPGRLALSLLAYFFDYLPHRPHVVTGRTNQHHATSVTTLYSSSVSSSSSSSSFLNDGFLTLPLLSQNYHNIHHLAPYVPFYLYGRIWRRYKKELIEAGTPVTPVFGFDRLKATRDAERVNRESASAAASRKD